LGVIVMVFILYETSITYPQISWFIVMCQLLFYLYALHTYNYDGLSQTDKVNDFLPTINSSYNWAKKFNL
jgi:hypothetical protein